MENSKIRTGGVPLGVRIWEDVLYIYIYMYIYIYLYIHIYIYIYTLGPPKFGHPMEHPLSEFWNFPNFGVYVFLDRKIKCWEKNPHILEDSKF